MTSLEFQTEQSRQSVDTPVTRENDLYISAPAMKWVSAVLLAYFGCRLLFFSLNISPFVPPDEVTHAGICKAFAQSLLFPDNTPATYEFGLVTNIPWLYYWIMGKLLHLNFFGLPDLVFLRLLNIPLAFGTVYFVRQTLLLLTDNRLTQLLVLVAMTNTAMFSLLSASVSYDNLANLLAAMSIYYLMAFFSRRSPAALYAAGLSQLAGCLTKITFLPLALALDVLLAAYICANRRTVPGALQQDFRQSGPRRWVTAALILIALGLNLHLYGGNYLRYDALNPSMATVLSTEKAMNYRLEARGTIFNLYKAGKISYMDALMLAGEIKHPGDKADTFYLLMNFENLKRNPQLWLGPRQYIKVWFLNMVSTVFGIKAHLIMVKETRYLVPLYLVMGCALLGFIVRWRPGDAGWVPLSLAAVTICYAGYLLYEVNYDMYRNYGAPGLTLYGRYLFPLLAPGYVLMCHYLLLLFRNRHLRWALALGTALLFIVYDFPWFLMHATPEWYDWLPR